MARDKEFEQRMQGMVYACRLAQEQGVDSLVKTVKQRGVTKVDITASDKQLNDMWAHCLIISGRTCLLRLYGCYMMLLDLDRRGYNSLWQNLTRLQLIL